MVFKMARGLQMSRSTPYQILQFIVNLEAKRALLDRKEDEAGNPCYYVIDDRYSRGKRLRDGSIQWHHVWRWNKIFVLSFGSGLEH